MPRFAEQQLYIGGQYVAASSGQTFDSVNPATGEVLAKVQRLSLIHISLRRFCDAGPSALPAGH